VTYLDPGLKEILLTAISTAGAVIGADRLATSIKGKFKGANGTHSTCANLMTQESHDAECDRRLRGIYGQLKEIKDDQKELQRDIKELLRQGSKAQRG